MECENELCIYQKDNNCILSSIKIDALGHCQECIHPHFSKKLLEYKKEELRKKYNE